MEFCYGEKNNVRILEEAGFWKRQESEHTVVIREVIPDLEAEFVAELEEAQRIFSQTEGTIDQYMKRLRQTCFKITPDILEEIICLIEVTLKQSIMFVDFLDTMIKESSVLRGNATAVIVVAHIMRESEYYIGIAKAYLSYAG